MKPPLRMQYGQLIPCAEKCIHLGTGLAKIMTFLKKS